MENGYLTSLAASAKSVWLECASAVLLVIYLRILIVEVDPPLPDCDTLLLRSCTKMIQNLAMKTVEMVNLAET